MKIGFTGPRDGMAAVQQRAFFEWIATHADDTDEFHHGCCVGSDEQAGCGVYDRHASVRVVGHPCTLRDFVSSAAKARCHRLMAPLPPLERNRNVVDSVDVVVACPKGPQEMRSGTWATVRFARKRGRRVVIIWPDGTVTEMSRKVIDIDELNRLIEEMGGPPAK